MSCEEVSTLYEARLHKVKVKLFYLQIAKKNENVHLKLQHVAKRLGDSYPIYDGLMRRRELENGGFICALNKFKVCPPNKRFSNRCKFSIGRYEHCCVLCALLCCVCFSVGVFRTKCCTNVL